MCIENLLDNQKMQPNDQTHTSCCCNLCTCAHSKCKNNDIHYFLHSCIAMDSPSPACTQLLHLYADFAIRTMDHPKPSSWFSIMQEKMQDRIETYEYNWKLLRSIRWCFNHRHLYASGQTPITWFLHHACREECRAWRKIEVAPKDKWCLIHHVHVHMLLVQFDASGTKSELHGSKCANIHQIGHKHISI